MCGDVSRAAVTTLIGSLATVAIFSTQAAASGPEPAAPNGRPISTLHRATQTFPRREIAKPRSGPQRPSQPRVGALRNVTVTVQVVPAPRTITRFTLEQNFPNPFSGSTTIRFALPKRAPCSISVYSVTGQRLATLVNWTYEPGEYSFQWNGTDDRGHRLRAGLYFCRAVAGPFSQSRKLIIQ